MRKNDNPVTKMFKAFKDIEGRCSLEAIAFSFKLDLDAVKRVLATTGWTKKSEGTTYQQCNSAINLLASVHLKTAKYHRNAHRFSVEMFLKKHPKGQFILNQEGHVCAVKNGAAYDNYSPGNYKLIGWWEITQKYDVKMCKLCKYTWKLITKSKYSLPSLPLQPWKK